jgi:hypothetical protein
MRETKFTRAKHRYHARDGMDKPRNPRVAKSLRALPGMFDASIVSAQLDGGIG